MIWWKFAKFPMSFSKPQSVFLQILDHSSVSWKINPLYLFSSNNIYFVQKEPIKVKIFDTFKCSGQNLPNSSCQFWNDTLIPLQILYHSSVSWKITPMYFFSSTSIYFAQKEHIKVNIFETFKCSGQNYWFVKSILKRQVNSSSNFASFFIVMTHNSFVNFKLILFLLLNYPIKLPILRLSSTLVKICHIPHFIFQTTSQFFFKFCTTLYCHWR